MNGMRQQPQAKNKDKFRALETELANVQAAVRISQLLMQRFMAANQELKVQLNQTMLKVTELQYRYLAVQEASGLSADKLDQMVEARQLKDFNEAAAKEDAALNYTEGDVVNDDSVITVTTKSSDESTSPSLFRSRMPLLDFGDANIIKGFSGQRVGHKVTTKLGNVDHEIELLAIRQPPKSEIVAQEEASNVVALPTAQG
jgi:hypothetical protein